MVFWIFMRTGIYLGSDLATHSDAVLALLGGAPALDKRLLRGFVDARGLPCPMPLLKSKIALREITSGAVYTVASDSNACADVLAFCQKNALPCIHWQSTLGAAQETVFHFWISKSA